MRSLQLSNDSGRWDDAQKGAEATELDGPWLWRRLPTPWLRPLPTRKLFCVSPGRNNRFIAERVVTALPRFSGDVFLLFLTTSRRRIPLKTRDKIIKTDRTTKLHQLFWQMPARCNEPAPNRPLPGVRHDDDFKDAHGRRPKLGGMSDFAMGKLMAELLSIGVPTEVRRKNWREDPNGAPPMRMLLVRSF